MFYRHQVALTHSTILPQSIEVPKLTSLGGKLIVGGDDSNTYSIKSLEIGSQSAGLTIGGVDIELNEYSNVEKIALNSLVAVGRVSIEAEEGARVANVALAGSATCGMDMDELSLEVEYSGVIESVDISNLNTLSKLDVEDLASDSVTINGAVVSSFPGEYADFAACGNRG